MKVRGFILVTSIFLLWSSLPANHHFHLPGKNKPEFVTACLKEYATYDKDIVLKDLSPEAVAANISLVYQQIAPWTKASKTCISPIGRSARYYLLFRVLRQ